MFFSRVSQAIAYYVFSNPVRARSLNLIEPGGSCVRRWPEFSGQHPNDVWARVCLAVRDILAGQTIRDQLAFKLYYCDKDRRWGWDDIAMQLNCSGRTVRRRVSAITEDLERLLTARGLLQPDDTPAQA
jgi:hypothetical protein